MPSFEIQSEHFTGPFDLILSLIEARKLLVSDISLASVADDFIRYVNTHDTFPVEEAAEFLVVAATLMYLKSKSLLPSLDVDEDEEEDARNLEKRLETYQLFRERARTLLKTWGSTYLFSRGKRMETPVRFVPGDLSSESIARSLARLFEEGETLNKRVLPEKTVRAMITLSEAMEKLKDRLSRSLTGSFKDLSGMGRVERVEVIVHFLALLELVKQGSLRVSQASPFDDIALTSEELNAPHYG